MLVNSVSVYKHSNTGIKLVPKVTEVLLFLSVYGLSYY